jgi:hypothetical protein
MSPVLAENGFADEATNEGSNDAQQYGDDAPAGVITRHDQLRDGACN